MHNNLIVSMVYKLAYGQKKAINLKLTPEKTKMGKNIATIDIDIKDGFASYGEYKKMKTSFKRDNIPCIFPSRVKPKKWMTAKINPHDERLVFSYPAEDVKKNLFSVDRNTVLIGRESRPLEEGSKYIFGRRPEGSLYMAGISENGILFTDYLADAPEDLPGLYLFMKGLGGNYIEMSKSMLTPTLHISSLGRNGKQGYIHFGFC